MAKLTTTDLTTLTNETSAVTTINNNNALIETAMENTLSRDGTSPNTMSADIDLNGNDLLNVGTLSLNGGSTLTEIIGYAEEWANKAEDSLISVAAGGDGSTEYSALHWAAKAAADVVLTNADVVSTNADVVLTNADVVSTNADVVAAAASAAAAAAAAASNLASKVSEKAADYTIVADTDDGTFFIADSSGGNVDFDLPSIATAGEGERYLFYRTSASNTVTLTRNGTDTINGVAGTYTINANVGECILVVADDASPDNWVVVPWTQAIADETTLTKTGSTISIKNLGVDTAQLAADAVDGTKMADNAVNSEHVADGAIDPVHITGGLNAQTGTTYTLVLGDAFKAVTMDNASANTLTVPTNASVAFATGARVDIHMKGAGVTTITGDTGVTINGVSAGSGALAQYGAASLLKVGTDTWLATGLTVA